MWSGWLGHMMTGRQFARKQLDKERFHGLKKYTSQWSCFLLNSPFICDFKRSLSPNWRVPIKMLNNISYQYLCILPELDTCNVYTQRIEYQCNSGIYTKKSVAWHGYHRTLANTVIGSTIYMVWMPLYNGSILPHLLGYPHVGSIVLLAYS